MPASGLVQTVLGPVRPEQLGVVLPHEHLLDDLLGPCQSAEEVGQRFESFARQARAHEGGPPVLTGKLETPASLLGRWEQGITLGTYMDVAKNRIFHKNTYRLLDVGDAIEEVMHFELAGGGCIVEQTSIGMARDPVGLQRISRATGIHVVMVTGFYVESTLTPEQRALDEGGFYDFMMQEIAHGTAWGVMPGMVGEIGLSWPVTDMERRSLLASARAARDSGLPLSIHSGGHRDAVFDALRTVEAAGGDLSRTVMCHFECRGLSPEDMVEVAHSGCYLEFDLFGRESTAIWSKGAVDWPNDAVRINQIAALIDRGFEKQILMSHDHAGKTTLHKWGGVGYDHILTSMVPVMRHKGFSNQLIERLLVKNPAEMLTIRG